MALAVFNCGQVLLKLQIRKNKKNQINAFNDFLITCHVNSVPLLHFAKPFFFLLPIPVPPKLVISQWRCHASITQMFL